MTEAAGPGPGSPSDWIAISGFSDEICLDKRLDIQAAVCAALGMEYVSLRFLDVGEGVRNVLDLSDREVAGAARMLGGHGLRVSSIGSPLGKVKLRDEEDGTSNRFREPASYLRDEVERACERAEAFGCRLVRGFSFYHPAGSNPRDHVAEAADRIREIVARCDAGGLTFGLELEANLIGQNAGLLMELHRRVNHPGLVLVFDGGNLVVQGYSAEEIFRQWLEMKPAVGWMHIKDCRRDPASSAGPSSARVDEERPWPFVPAGEGDAAYPEVLRDLMDELPTIMSRLAARGIGRFFLDLEPHVASGGQFGGYSGARGFGASLAALRGLLAREGLESGRPRG